MRKLIRSIRLDQSDSRIFDRAAEPGEWAVPGTFVFLALAPEQASRKEKLAFASGWLGCDSFGHCTLVEVAEITEADHTALVQHLARHLIENYGAPGEAEALSAAREEVSLAGSLAAEHKIGTMLALGREIDEQGNIREAYRLIQPYRAEEHARIWTIIEDEEGDTPLE